MKASKQPLPEIIANLRAGGARITTLREFLVSILLSSPRPISAGEIISALKK